ncbi:predicted protein [Naegleria gruberi]|uniref:Predicted protein n=1 Tax=Naegleria gruberi TaxID=5762 RepID=D2VEU7_NAEGR|nr:uncharacterized protein NAEGRDRAFT_48961 [Naegleria gruberi]EFC44665.1 predicted protein [Naegleria gruberi]|eukprot:XP_002677409.1 predicted protein [Naegleria gruberi strain NEG-M]
MEQSKRSIIKLLNSTSNNQEDFRIIKKLPNHVMIANQQQQYERIIALRMRNQQFVCILKSLSSLAPMNLESSCYYQGLQSPLTMLLPTRDNIYQACDGGTNDSYCVVMNCVLRERLSQIKIEVTDGIILQIIYQYLGMMKKLDDFFKKPNHQRKCNRPEVSVERFDRKSKRIDLIFGSTDLLSNCDDEQDADRLLEISDELCIGRNEFEKEMVFEIVEFITQEHGQKNFDTRVILPRLEKAFERNEFSSIYLDVFKCIMNGGPKAYNNLLKSSLFSTETPRCESFGSFFSSLNEKLTSSKKVFMEAFQIGSDLARCIHSSLSADRDIIKMLIESNPTNIQNIDTNSIESDREFIKELIDINPLILVHGYFESLAKDEELWLRAILKNPISMMGYYREDYSESENFKQKLKEIAVEHGYLITRCDLADLFLNDRESIMKLLSKYGYAYPRIPDGFKADLEIVKIALSNCGHVFSNIPKELKNDRELALIAVKENGCVFKMLDSELKQDPEIITLAGKYAKPDEDYY